MVSVQLILVLAWNVQLTLVHSVMQCTQVSQFLRLSCVLYVTALEAYWCTEASAALLSSLDLLPIHYNTIRTLAGVSGHTCEIAWDTIS